MRENPSSARDTSDSMKQNINVPCILGKISFDTSQKRFMPKSFNNWSQIDARSMQDLTSAFFYHQLKQSSRIDSSNQQYWKLLKNNLSQTQTQEINH